MDNKEQTYLPDFVKHLAQSGNFNQHAKKVEMLADFAMKRDQEFYSLRNDFYILQKELNNIKTIAFHLGEDKIELLRINTKLVCSLDLIRETMNGGDVQDLHQTINDALAEHESVTEAYSSEPDLSIASVLCELLNAAEKVNALCIQTPAHKELRAAIAKTNSILINPIYRKLD